MSCWGLSGSAPPPCLIHFWTCSRAPWRMYGVSESRKTESGHFCLITKSFKMEQKERSWVRQPMVWCGFFDSCYSNKWINKWAELNSSAWESVSCGPSHGCSTANRRVSLQTREFSAYLESMPSEYRFKEWMEIWSLLQPPTLFLNKSSSWELQARGTSGPSQPSDRCCFVTPHSLCTSTQPLLFLTPAKHLPLQCVIVVLADQQETCSAAPCEMHETADSTELAQTFLPYIHGEKLVICVF